MKKLRIAIIEDETLVALELSQSIQKFGFEVIDYATNIKTAQSLLKSPLINLILMDINLKESMDGIEFYKMLNSSIPIVYLTAYTDSVTITRAINTEPLGYLIKPIDENELFALLQLAKNRIIDSSSFNTEQIIELKNGFLFDKRNEKLFCNEAYINLGYNELKLFKMLLAARGGIVTFQNICDEIYNNEFISDSTLRTLIYRLKKKLSNQLILTEYNLGIRLDS